MDDVISRQAAIKTINKVRDACDTESLDDYRDLLTECFEVMPPVQPSFPQAHENDCISREEAIKALGEEPEVWSGKDEYAQGLNNQWHYDVNALKAAPPTQPEQLERCPIYGGVCGYPSDQCYECPRHSGAQPEQRWIPVTEWLPAYGEDVLISIGGYCNVGHIVSVNEEKQYNWYFSGWYHSPNDVDAWMPLPEPYRKEGE